MLYTLALRTLEWARILRFRFSSWLRLSARAGALAITDIRDSVVLAFLLTTAVAVVDAFGLTRLDRLRQYGWYDDVSFVEEFPRSPVSGEFLIVIFGTMGVIVALLFSISLVAHQVSTERFGETVAPLLFREPLTAFIRSLLVVGSIFVLTNLFVQSAGIYVPFLGTYLSFGVLIISIALLPVYVSQSLTLSKVTGAAQHLSRDAISAISAVSAGRRLGRSVEVHLRGRTTTSLSDAQVLIDQLDQKLADEEGAATVVIVLPPIFRFYLARKHLIDVRSGWFPTHEVVERTPYGHSLLRDIYGQFASGPPRQQERNLDWLEVMIIEMIEGVEDAAFERRRLVLLEATIKAFAEISEAAAREFRFDLLERIVGKWFELCGRTIVDDRISSVDDRISSPFLQGIATVVELLVRMEDSSGELGDIAERLARGELDSSRTKPALVAVVEEYSEALRKEIAHEGRVVTPKEFIARDLAKAWNDKIGDAPERLLVSCFDSLSNMTGKLIEIEAAKHGQEVALASLVLQRRAVVLGGKEPSRELVRRAATLALAAYGLDVGNALHGRDLLNELVRWIGSSVHADRHPLAQDLIDPTLDVIAEEFDQGGSRRINAMRTLLALGGMLELDSEFRQDDALLDSYVDKIVASGFRRDQMEALRDSNRRMFTPIIGGDLIMEFQWLANAFHPKLDALVQPGSSALSLNPRINHPSQLLQQWAPGLGIEDTVDAFLDYLIGKFGTQPHTSREESSQGDE